LARKLTNRLNDLTGSQWLYWTDTIYLTNYPPDVTHSLRKEHGAMKPPEVMADIIRFFTKSGELVLDPFAGVGGTLLGAALAGRQALGYELNPRWLDIYRQIKREFRVVGERFVRVAPENPGEGLPITGEMLAGDCLELMTTLSADSIDAIITDPPYGCQHGVSGFAEETNFNMFNGGEGQDFANAPDFETFMTLMHRFGQQAYRVLKGGRYLVLMVGDRYRHGEYIPLGFMVAVEMRRVGFKLKGIKVWSNRATVRPLKPYAVKSCFVPNITHQHIIILRK